MMRNTDFRARLCRSVFGPGFGTGGSQTTSSTQELSDVGLSSDPGQVIGLGSDGGALLLGTDITVAVDTTLGSTSWRDAGSELILAYDPALREISITDGTPTTISLADAVNAGLMPAGSVERLAATGLTRAGLVSAAPPAPVMAVRTTGYASAGDGGGALHVRAADGTGPGAVQDAAGQWWRPRPHAGAHDVRAFGATGTGGDDTAAIAAAEAAAFADGAVLVLPSGGVFGVLGSRVFRVPIRGHGATLRNISTTPETDIADGVVRFAGRTDLFVAGLTVDGGGIAPGIVATDSARLRFEDCRAVNCHGAGLSAYTSADLHYAGCSVAGVVYTGSAADGFYCGGCSDVVYTGCRAEDVRRIGFVSEASGTVRSTRISYSQCLARNANNCDDSTTEFNAGFWFENTNGVTMHQCVAREIAGNPGQTSGRVVGVVLNAAGDTQASVSSMTDCLVGDTAATLPVGVRVSGTDRQATAVLRGVQIGNHRQGVLNLGNLDLLEVDGLTLTGGTYSADDHGGVVSIVNVVNKHPIRLRGLVERAAVYTSDEAATVNFHSATATTVTLEDSHAISVVTKGQDIDAIRVANCTIEARSATSSILAAAVETISDTGFALLSGVGRVFAAVGGPSGALTQVQNCRFAGLEPELGKSGNRLSMTNCSFEDCAFGWTPNGTGELSLTGCTWSNPSLARPAIQTNFNADTSDDSVVVTGGHYSLPLADHAIAAWPGAGGPDTLRVSGVSYETLSGFTDIPAIIPGNAVAGTLADGGSVAGVETLRLTGGTGTLSALAGGVEGQRLTLVGAGSTQTLLSDGVRLRLTGNFTFGAGRAITLICTLGGASPEFTEITRNTGPEIVSRTASHTLTHGDIGALLRVDAASATLVTVPAGLFVPGQQVTVHQAGAGQTSLAAGTGVTIDTADSLSLAKQHAVASLLCVAPDQFILFGNLETV